MDDRIPNMNLKGRYIKKGTGPRQALPLVVSKKPPGGKPVKKS